MLNQHSSWRSCYVSINKFFSYYSDKLICCSEITQSPKADKNPPKSVFETSPAGFCNTVICTTQQMVPNISCEILLKIEFPTNILLAEYMESDWAFSLTGNNSSPIYWVILNLQQIIYLEKIHRKYTTLVFFTYVNCKLFREESFSFYMLL